MLEQRFLKKIRELTEEILTKYAQYIVMLEYCQEFMGLPYSQEVKRKLWLLPLLEQLKMSRGLKVWMVLIGRDLCYITIFHLSLLEKREELALEEEK